MCCILTGFDTLLGILHYLSDVLNSLPNTCCGMENHKIRKIVTELGCVQQFPTYIKKLN